MNKLKSIFKLGFLVLSLSMLTLFFQNCSPSMKTGSDAGAIDLSLSVRSPSSQKNPPPVSLEDTAENRFKLAQKVIQAKCTSCHYESSKNGPMLFSSESDYETARLVSPGSISQSKLITSLRKYPVVGALRTMPKLPASDLTDLEYATLTNWISKLSSDGGGGGGGENVNVFKCDVNEAPQKLSSRRLSKAELANSLYNLLSRSFAATDVTQILYGNANTFTNRIPNDSAAPFTRADNLTNSGHSQGYFDLADEIANAVTNPTRLQSFVSTFVNYNNAGCTSLNVSSITTACLETFTRNFALRAWGRPIDTTNNDNNNEWASLVKSFTIGTTSAEKVSNVVFRVLLSPAFLNQVYVDVVPSTGQKATLSSYAIARRLAFHYMRSNVDENLLQIAIKNDLRTDTGFAVALNYAQQKSQGMVTEFTSEWFKLNSLVRINNPGTNKFNQVTAGLNLNENLRTAMVQEVNELVNYLDQNARPAKELLTNDISFARNADLMKIYGLNQAAPATVNEQNAVRFPKDTFRSGIPGRAAYLFSGGDTERPITRGNHVRLDFLCAPVKGTIPPGAGDTKLPAGLMTTREKTTAMTSSSQCIGCHSQLNPFGFAYSQFNAVGAFQNQEPIFTNNTFAQNLPVDAKVDLASFFGRSYMANGASELHEKLAETSDFKMCVSQKYYTFLQRYSAQTTSLNSCDMQKMFDVISNNGSLREFFAAPVMGPLFKQRVIVK